MWLEGKGCGVERGKGERGRFWAGLTDWYLCLPIVLSRLIYFVILQGGKILYALHIILFRGIGHNLQARSSLPLHIRTRPYYL